MKLSSTLIDKNSGRKSHPMIGTDLGVSSNFSEILLMNWTYGRNCSTVPLIIWSLNWTKFHFKVLQSVEKTAKIVQYVTPEME